ncbi:Imm52 family immunity protein [Providencia sp. JUb39]|uniref:Imm52 family immunity protein n=1 Tax=Providencia sp. JUb39 TaxID=2724165 RepID=UPI00164DB574|nr:Imm52 family immunity protein [Providencia sp. JUb39]MBC5792058.1 immunity 52 family protein [Providencia sp. JUb39]
MDISIKIDIELNDQLSLQTLMSTFSEMIAFTDLITNNKELVWYFCGDSLEEALNQPAFKDNYPTLFFEERQYIDIIEGIWSSENKALVIKGKISSLKYNLDFDLREIQSIAIDKIKDILCSYLKKFDVFCIRVDINDYEYKSRNVFPDRLPVGWMLYLNKKIMPEQVPMAAQLIHIDNEKNHGTLIISTDHVFDGENKDDIKKANEIEIQLAGLGLLPLIREIYS